MEYRKVAKPIEASALYGGAPLFSLGLLYSSMLVICLGQCMLLSILSSFLVRVHSLLL